MFGCSDVAVGGACRIARVLALAAVSMLPSMAMAASSVLIWPIDPVIQSAEKASALWLENRGAQPVTLQVRVLEWGQQGYEDRYAAQRAVIGSPPMARIEPGKKQLVRLIKAVPAPAGQEMAYRILVDEIPVAPEVVEPGEMKAGVNFQMRYSVPLFVYGDGLAYNKFADQQREASTARPQLSWKIVGEGGRRFVEIANSGTLHARLARASFKWSDGRQVVLSQGLLGYVLAGAAMRWPLPAGVDTAATLSTSVNMAKDSVTVTAAN